MKKLLILLILLYGCEVSEFNQQPTAMFAYTQQDSIVYFRCASTDDNGIVERKWDVDGDMNWDIFNIQNISVTYSMNTIVTVTLFVADAEGWSDSHKDKIIIE